MSGEQDNKRSDAERQAWEHFAQFDSFRYQQIYDTIERIQVWCNRIYKLTGSENVKAVLDVAQSQLDDMVDPYSSDDLDDTQPPKEAA